MHENNNNNNKERENVTSRAWIHNMEIIKKVHENETQKHTLNINASSWNEMGKREDIL